MHYREDKKNQLRPSLASRLGPAPCTRGSKHKESRYDTTYITSLVLIFDILLVPVERKGQLQQLMITERRNKKVMCERRTLREQDA